MAHFVNSAARAAYAEKTNSELLALQARVVQSGLRNKDAMKTADGQRVVSIAVRGGQFVNVTAAESSYNACRNMWKDIQTILIERGVV